MRELLWDLADGVATLVYYAVCVVLVIAAIVGIAFVITAGGTL